jgi:hypothetical protein
MASTIQLKTGTGSAVPTSLTQGEVAINIDNGLIYYGSGSTNTRKQLESFTNITASGNISASGNLTVNNTTASGDISSSNTVQGFTGSFHYIKVTDNLEVDGDLTVGGTVTAQEFHTEFISSSIIFESGSTIFGNSADDTHTFSGSITASGNISSSGTVTANSIVGTLATAAQTNITSLGTLTTLTVDHITINSSTISDNNELILDAGDNIILDTEEDIIFKDDGTTRYIFNVDSTPEIDIVGDLIIDPSGGDVKFSGANINVEGHITASGNISASGELSITDNTFIGGRLSVNTTSTSARVNVVGTQAHQLSGGSNSFKITGVSNADALFVSSSGKVGIGTTEPTEKLQVEGNISASGNIIAVSASIQHLDGPEGGGISFTGGNPTLKGEDGAQITLTDGATISGGNNTLRVGTIVNVNTTHITASGNISASGTIIANSIIGGDIDGGHITINSSTISDNSDLTLDAGGDITLDTEEDIIFKEDGTTRYIFRMDSTPEIDIVGDLIIDPSGGDVKFSGANINVEGHITASGNISASGTITADDGSGKQFTVRPNLYFFATNTSATTQTLHGSNAGDQEGSLPATNTTTITLSQQQNSHSSVFSLSSNRLTISRAGLYKFTYNAVIEINNGSGRAEGFCGLVQETSAGDVTLVNGSEARGYHRFKHDQGPSGVTFAATVIVNVAANSIYDLRFGQEDQSVAGAQLRTLPSGTAITVEAIT